jgi:tRNA threonylcarbamoyladenosine biosynthesis protein TsaB
MSLLLAIESTSGLYSVAAGTGDEVGSRRASRREDPGFAGLGELVSATLAELGAGAADIDRLAVDVGPGNLSSVRAAVAYVNGLAFSLSRPVFCANSLELMAVGLVGGPVPVLCVRKASGGNAYLGRYGGDGTPTLTFGKLERVVPALCGDLTAVAVAGAFRDQVAKLLPDCHVIDSGVDHPAADVLYRMARADSADSGRLVAQAQALNEGSRVFHAHAAS